MPSRPSARISGSLSCAPARLIETPSSPTRNGRDGSSSRIRSRSAPVSIGRNAGLWPGRGRPMVKAPARSLPVSVMSPRRSSWPTPMARVIARRGSPSGSRFISHGTTIPGACSARSSGMVSEMGNARAPPRHASSYRRLGAPWSIRISATMSWSAKIGGLTACPRAAGLPAMPHRRVACPPPSLRRGPCRVGRSACPPQARQ